VAPTVELDEILRVFNPQTKAAFRNWVHESAQTISGTAPQDFNDALGNLAGFAQDGANVLKVLDDQSTAVRLLVKNTGEVFGALSERKGQLRGLVVNSERTFNATASEQKALADTFFVFPTFLDESKATADRLERFAVNTHPLVNELKPVADNLAPTVRDVSALAPDLQNLFVHLKPVIRTAPQTLPDAARFLRGARPVVDALHTFLPELNPILSYVNWDQQVVAHFISIGGTAVNYRINGDPSSHMLPQFGVINGNSLSFFNKQPSWVRGNAYVQPNTYDRAIPLGTIESFSCANAGGTQRYPADNGGNNSAPPCFQVGPSLYDGNVFPNIGKGQVSHKPAPNNSLSGAYSSDYKKHP
jgi:hypothetical protein